jgi:prepilin-type N-terminal cleavage/methylation domain-containing protein
MLSRLLAPRRDESGFTLVEVLVALAIMSVAFVAIIAGLAVFFRGVRTQRGTADFDAAARSHAEQLLAQPYADCLTVSPTTLAGGFSATVDVRYWDGIDDATVDFVATCTTDHGVQQLTVTLSRDGRTDAVTVVKRRAS